MQNPFFKGLVLGLAVLFGMVILTKVGGLNPGLVFALAVGVIFFYAIKHAVGSRK